VASLMVAMILTYIWFSTYVSQRIKTNLSIVVPALLSY